MTQTTSHIRPVILAGGSGERLWPASKTNYPKQFASFTSDQNEASHSLFQESLHRVSNRGLFHAPIIICNEEHRFIVTEQLRQLNIDDATIIIEAIAKNTAPALALAALHLRSEKEEGIMLVMPSDHRIERPENFFQALQYTVDAAQNNWLVTFGVKPTKAETGYGYIKCGAIVQGFTQVQHIERFVEKPDAATAQSYIDDGHYVWNSGIFMMDSTQALKELAQYEPSILTSCEQAYEKRSIDHDFIRMDKDAITPCPSISIDYAIMERTQKGVVLTADMQWCDLGSWTAICSLSDQDAHGNATIGRVVMVDSHDCYMRTEDALIATIGVKDLVVVSSDNAILIGPKNRMQDIKQLVLQIRQQQPEDTTLTSFSHRPWGSFYCIDHGEHYQVKRLHVKPGGKISLQTHARRSEHWVVVKGIATVTNGEDTHQLKANQSTYIPAGNVHRLENRESDELIVIEIQTGDYLGEDDITRFEDDYNRP